MRLDKFTDDRRGAGSWLWTLRQGAKGAVYQYHVVVTEEQRRNHSPDGLRSLLAAKLRIARREIRRNIALDAVVPRELAGGAG